MKICIIAELASSHTRRWAKALSEEGMDVYVISYSESEIEKVNIINTQIYSSNIFTQWGNLKKIKKIINEIKPDVIHLFGLFSLLSFRTMFLVNYLSPLVVSVWGSDIIPGTGKETFVQKFIKKFLLKRADVILATSEYLAYATETYVSNPNKIEVLYWGVDTKLFSPEKKEAEKDCTVLGFAKLLYGLSAPDILLKAVAKARELSDKKILLRIAGDGAMKDELIELAESLGLKDSIEWCGWIEGEVLVDFYRSLDIFIMPSRKESFGLAAVEALASGLPVIASRFGGIPEIIGDGVNGFLTDPEDVDMLAEAIVKLADNPALMRKMGEAGREIVEKQFDWQKTLRRVKEVYSETALIK